MMVKAKKQKGQDEGGGADAQQGGDQPPDDPDLARNALLNQKAFGTLDPSAFDITINNMISSQQMHKEVIELYIFDQQQDRRTLYPSTEIYVNEKDEIIVSYLIQNLKKTGLIPENCLISYYDTVQDMYVYLGKDPLRETAVVPKGAIMRDSLQIKLRGEKRDIVQQLLQEQNVREDQSDEGEPAGGGANGAQRGNNSRVKERKIGEVVEKVALWRRFYTGFFDETGKFVQFPLDVAATKVGISKKTLDDYLLQIRCGKKFGFDFNKHQGDRIGKLRSFVKDKRKGEGKGGHAGDEMDAETHDNDA